jgi:hypothetical protein
LLSAWTSAVNFSRSVSSSADRLGSAISSISERPPVVGLTILLVLGLVDAWAGRQSYVAGDTISYMDMASGIARGDLTTQSTDISALFIPPFWLCSFDPSNRILSSNSPLCERRIF